MHLLAIDVQFIACVIISPSTFTYYLESNFISESGLSYFRVLAICLLLVYFVGAAGCHCFDFIRSKRGAAVVAKLANVSQQKGRSSPMECTSIFSDASKKEWGERT